MKILIIALEYLEPEWQQTLDCIKESGLPYQIVKRDGVGNMSRAFNSGFFKFAKGYDFVWFVTNITFTPETPRKLAANMGEFAAIHPAMITSDHKFLHPKKGVHKVPFIEFTAPMFKVSEFDYLDTELWHYYMDLDICERLRQKGKYVAVDGDTPIGHVYLRNGKKHPITLIREQLRNLMAEHGKKHMEYKYGVNWRHEIWHKHYEH